MNLKWRSPKKIARAEPAGALRDWAPPIASIAIGCLLLADMCHTVWILRDLARVQPSPKAKAEPTTAAPIDPALIVNAHLFGESQVAVAAADPQHSPDTDLPLALRGVVAADDPRAGYAILGAADRPTHLYRTGAVLEEIAGGRLQQVFVDRIVLELNGKAQTLRLPRQSLFGTNPGGISGGEPSVAQSEAPTTPERDPDVITPAEGFFANLNVEQTNLGESAGLVLHPAKRIQRQYGLADSDILTAVDGVEITDAQALANTLRTNAKSLSLTYVHDGVPRTVKLQMVN